MCAIKKLETNCGLFICNLGTGKGYSVLDVIHAFSKACGKEIPCVIDPRRPGDIAECYADPTKAKNELGWVAEFSIKAGVQCRKPLCQLGLTDGAGILLFSPTTRTTPMAISTP